MANAVLVELAEEIKTLIEDSGVAGSNAEISRNYIQHERLENIQNTEIWVQPNDARVEPITRIQDIIEYDIDVTIFKRCKTTDETDDLLLLAEQIYLLLKRANIDGYTISNMEFPTIFSPDELVERNLFAGVITVTLKEG